MSYNNNYKPSEMADAIREIIKIGQETDLCPTSRSLTIKQQAVNAKTLSISETMVPGALKGRWILIGGVKRQVINNSTSGIVLNEAIESAAIGTKIYPGEDGENPNYVETIVGTLANLLQTSDHTISELAAEINGGNATVLLDIDGSQAGFPGVFKFSLLPSLGGSSNYIGGSLNAFGNAISDTIAVSVDFETPNSLYYFEVLSEGIISNLTSAGDQFPTTLTIIHHPISGSSVTVEPLSVSSNGTYSAPIGEAFNPVTVDIPVYDGSISNV